MELRELNSFCYAARLRSISKAAELLELGQPTVTTHIQKLESDLGVVLFDRVKRPIQLTKEGEELYELAMPLIEGMDSLVAKLKTAEHKGSVSVATTPDMIPHTLLQVVRNFRAEYPQMPIRLLSRNRARVLELVNSGEVDLGLVPARETNLPLEFHALFTYERVLIAPLGHPILGLPVVSLEDIATWPLILMSPGTYTRTLLEGLFQRKGLRYQVVVEMESMDMIKRYVALGMGISVGPRLAIDPEDERHLGVVSLSHLLPVDQAGVITLRGKHLARGVLNFISVLEKTVREERAGRQV
ncbi:MAG: LysR family transcriptional regulator [Chloroflexi bacterium]|nr:LysR family transcriptional regulator [Chloroflexota bacterium]